MISEFVFTVSPDDYKQKYNNLIEDFKKHSIWGTFLFRFGIMMGCICLMLPLNLLKNISSLRFTTVAGIVCILIVLVVFIVELPSYLKNYFDNIYKEDDIKTHINVFRVVSFNGYLDFIQRIGNILLAYIVHLSVFSIYANLYNNNETRTNKVLQRSVLLDGIVYLMFGIIGYLTQVVNTPDLALSREPLPGSKDIIMGICRLLIALLIFVKVPVIYNSFRLSLFFLITEKNEINKIPNFITTISVTVLAATIGVLYSKIINIISFLGGFTGVIISYTLPGLIYLKALELPLSHWKSISTIICCGGISIIGYIGAVLSVIEFFTGK